MTKKRLAKVGMVVSIIVAICGVLVMLGAMGGDANNPGGASSYYDKGYASFGADFYSFVNNNAAEAADAAQTTASNLVDIADLLRNVCGIFLTGFGMMGFCLFGMINAGVKEAEKATMSAPATTEEAVTLVEATPEVSEAEVVVEETTVETEIPSTEPTAEEVAEAAEIAHEYEDKEKILAKLHELKDEGILTEEEFEAEKEKLLSK